MTELDEEDPNVQAAILGRQVEVFLDSDIGKYLVSRAENEAADALEQLKVISTWRKRRILELQNRIWVAEHFQEWLGQAFSEGIHALNIIEGVADGE
jgi:hypothetical protein